MENLLETYNDIRECPYKNEHYSVRDNGAVLRHSPGNNRKRPADNKWTFGKQNIKTGYSEIASERVHRIVAYAFHGKPPTYEHVVDHIDTNKLNNMPSNLRWVTRLENILLNPITVKKIEIVCGCSVEEFLDNPSKFRNKFKDQNYAWMCAVTTEEAKESKKRLLAWAKSDKHPSGGSLGDWIYSRAVPKKEIPEFTPGGLISLLGFIVFNILAAVNPNPDSTYPAVLLIFLLPSILFILVWWLKKTTHRLS